MSHPVDFVGLNRFIYDINGWDIDDKTLNPFYGTSDNTGLGQEIKVINSAPIAIYVDQNHIGSLSEVERFVSAVLYKNEQYPATLTDLPTYFTALTLHRNGPYGYSSWQQTRASHNPLSRRQRKHNVFTYYEEPGELIDKKDLTGKRIIQKPRRSKIIKKIEQPLSQKYKPLELGMGIAPDDQDFGKCNDITLTMKSSHGNEINFFDHLSVAKYYDKDLDTSDNYENIKALYLDGALDSEASPLQSFRFLRYAETIYPSTRNVYRNHTRMRQEYVFRWSDEIKERIEPGISLKNDPFFSLPGAIDNGFKFEVPYQSKWNLDAGWNFEIFTGEQDGLFDVSYLGAIDDYHRSSTVRRSIHMDSKFTWPIGGANKLNDTYDSYNYSYDETIPTGKNTAGGEGQLQNSYCLFADFRQLSSSTSGYVSNIDRVFSASCLYNRRHVVPSYYGLVAPSGMYIEELEQKKQAVTPELIDIHQSFGGATKWQVGETRKIFDKDGNLVSAPVNPFYETYDKFCEHTKIVGKDYSLVPEFKISDHVETYEKIGLTEQNLKLFDVLGGLSGSEDGSKEKFYKVYSNSDFMEHFGVIKDDHKNFAEPSMITLQCKAVKKFLPYDGFYPNQRTEALGKQFIKSYSDHFRVVECRTYEVDDPTQLLPLPSSVRFKFFHKVFHSASLNISNIDYENQNEGVFSSSTTTGSYPNIFNYGRVNETSTGNLSPSLWTNSGDIGQTGKSVCSSFALFSENREIGSKKWSVPSLVTNADAECDSYEPSNTNQQFDIYPSCQIALGSHPLYRDPNLIALENIGQGASPYSANTDNTNPQYNRRWKDHHAGSILLNDVNNNMVVFMVVAPEHWEKGGEVDAADCKNYFSGSWESPYDFTSRVSRDYFFPSCLGIRVGKQNGQLPVLATVEPTNPYATGAAFVGPLKAVSKQLIWHIDDENNPFFGDVSTDAGIRKFEQRSNFTLTMNNNYNEQRKKESVIALPIVLIRGGTAERTAKAFANAVNAINAATIEDGSAASAVHNYWKLYSEQGGFPPNWQSGFEARATAEVDQDGNWNVTVTSTDASAIHAAEEYRHIPSSTCTGVTVNTIDSEGKMIDPSGRTDYTFTTSLIGEGQAVPLPNGTTQISPRFIDIPSPYTESNHNKNGFLNAGSWTTAVANQLKQENIHECSEDSLYPKIQPIITPLFAPGVLYNTIKSGIACDYPLMTDNIRRVLGEVQGGNTDPNQGFWMIGCRLSQTSAYIDEGADAPNWKENTSTTVVLPSNAEMVNQNIFNVTTLTASSGSNSGRAIYEIVSRRSNIYNYSFRGFNLRIPFEALVEPENYMSNVTFMNQEPDQFLYFQKYARVETKSRWDGQGDLLYKKMAHNFLAEIPEFFLKGKNFKKLSSLPQGDANFGNVESMPIGPFGNTLIPKYKMRVKIYRSLDKPRRSFLSNGVFVDPPQDHCIDGEDNPRETITMYSRPSAFGPPSWDANYKYTGADHGAVSGYGSDHGYNFPFTPPYYHGEAWADITFEPTRVGRHTLDEILSNSTVKYYRFWHPDSNMEVENVDENTTLSYTDWTNSLAVPTSQTGNYYAPQHPLFINDNAMQLDSSLNLFGKEEIEFRAKPVELDMLDVSTYVEATDQNRARWCIQPKFETPILNFQHNKAIQGDGRKQVSKISLHKMLYSNHKSHNLWDVTTGGKAVTPEQCGAYYDNRIIVYNADTPYNIWFSDGEGRFAPYFNETANCPDSNPASQSPPSGSNTIKVDWSPHVTLEATQSDLSSLAQTLGATLQGAGFETIVVGSEVFVTASVAGPAVEISKLNIPDTHITVETVTLGTTSSATSTDQNIILSKQSPYATTRGMWHQYGLKPSGQDGVFMRIEDIPYSWAKGAQGIAANRFQYIKSLADLVGFSKEPVRLGEVADTKTIHEAVVAVPFTDIGGERNFFELPRRDIENALENNPEIRIVGTSIVEMVNKMKKYVFPPSMDFVNNKDITPFAMYIFEFSHVLDSQDLTDIWQNLPPQIGRSYDTAVSSISHKLLSSELIGGGSTAETADVSYKENENKGLPVPSNIRWMVFKVKQRAKTNYFDKVIRKQGVTDEDEKEKLLRPTFNWPYDYFSLVELVKINASVVFSSADGTPIESNLTYNKKDIIEDKPTKIEQTDCDTAIVRDE